jgi:hypothetical protein
MFPQYNNDMIRKKEKKLGLGCTSSGTVLA